MRRSGFLAAGGAALGVLSAGGPSPAAVADQTIMLIRHAEKPQGPGAPYGIRGDGEPDAHALIVDGWCRAGALVDLFAPARSPLRAGIRRPGAVFATRPGDANLSLRPLQTVTPLAERLGIAVGQAFAFGQERALAEHLLATPGTTLTAWQHQHIPLIAELLGFAHLGVPKVWPGTRFDMVFVFSRVGTRWSFAQVPQLLLAGDLATPFPPISDPGTPD